MKEQLVTNNNIKNFEKDNLLKEIKKMSYIQYSILLLSIIRFILMFFLILLFTYFPKSFTANLFTVILFLYVILITPILNIYLLIIAITGKLNRDFWSKNKKFNLGLYTCFCCCCIMSKNVSFLKMLTIINSIIKFAWSSCLLYYLLNDSSQPNLSRFFPYNFKRVLYKIIINFIDSFILFSLYYCFYYSEFFLNRVEKYLEYYKRLIIKNRNKEAEFVRNTLPATIEDYISNETELQNV